MMKKITFLFTLLTVSLGFSQATHTIDFEPAGIGNGWAWTASEVNPTFALTANPVSGGINTSATVAEFVAKTTDQNWALCFTSADGEFTFDNTNKIVKIMVYKPTISGVGVKFEGPGGVLKELVVPNTVTNQWEEITIDFTSEIGKTFNLLVIIPDFVTPYVNGKDRTTNNTLYFDNIQVPNGVTLGTKDFKIEGLNVSPNPSKNSWTIKTSNVNMSAIKVYDILGKNVLSLAPNATDATINGSSLKAGLYFAQIKTAKGVSSIKLVKE